MSNLDDRITAALNAAADQVSDADLTPAAPPTMATAAPPRRPIRWIAPVIAAAAVAGIAITVTAVVVHHPQAAKTIQPGHTNTPTPTGPANTSPISVATTTSNSPSAIGTGPMVCYFADASPCKVPAGFGWYVPLWPFANYAGAKEYRFEKTLSIPPNPSQLALAFTRDYLGFTDIDRVTGASITGDQAKVGVGYLNPAGEPVTAAVLHIVRYEEYAYSTAAPWEVVGSEDTTLSLESPNYGSSVGYNFTAGGHISGTDENIHLWLRALNFPGAIVDDCCLPAGGDKSPWTRAVGLAQPYGLGKTVPAPVILVVSTGGHVQQHERFAIQGFYVLVSSSS